VSGHDAEADAVPVDPRPAHGSPWRWLHNASEVAWRSLVIALAVLAVGGLLWKLRVVVLALLVALLVTSVLAPAVVALARHGHRSLTATWIVLVGSVLIACGLFAVVIVPTVGESEAIVDAVSDGVVDIENWLVDGPLGVERSTIREVTEDPLARLGELAQASSSVIFAGVRTVGEILAGALLAIVLTVLLLKDGRQFQAWMLDHLPERHHDEIAATAGRAWGALAGFIRGAALLGLVEGIVIGVTLWLVGSPLYGPVAVLTFMAAFFPVVGAIVAGAVAVLVALAAGGPVQALIVLAVAVTVQQLDADLLAPLIYGRSLSVHPAVVVLVLTGGGVLGGIAGAFVAVPITGAVSGMAAELWERHGRPWARAGDRSESPDDDPDDSDDSDDPDGR
jgi:putative heme transporter